VSNARLSVDELAPRLLSGMLTPEFVLQELRKIDQCGSKEEELIHLLYLFIADEDIFRDDEKYREMQTEKLKSSIHDVEGERNQH
jgi:hypothetical protein